MREVTLSAYWIDRFPVSNRRYAECVDAGACEPPVDDGSAEFVFGDPAYDDMPVAFVDWARANAFCTWDGGRRLPTEAQVEKAARGPAPRAVDFPWGDTPDCSKLYIRQCEVDLGTDPTWDEPFDRIDGLPGTRSFYGVEGLSGLGSQWTREYFDQGIYGDASFVVDPDNQTTSEWRSTRGENRRVSWIWQEPPVWQRSLTDPRRTSRWETIRCVRETF